MGAIWYAIFTYFGPVQSACGMISPKSRISTTEISTAIADENIWSRKIGRVSIAAALQRSNVTSIQWCWSITGKIRSVISFTWLLPIESTSSAKRSIEARPTVRPDIIPANRMQKVDTIIAI